MSIVVNFAVVCEVLTVGKMDARREQYVDVGSCCFGVGIFKCCRVARGLICVTRSDGLFILKSVIHM